MPFDVAPDRVIYSIRPKISVISNTLLILKMTLLPLITSRNWIENRVIYLVIWIIIECICIWTRKVISTIDFGSISFPILYFSNTIFSWYLIRIWLIYGQPLLTRRTATLLGKFLIMMSYFGSFLTPLNFHIVFRKYTISMKRKDHSFSIERRWYNCTYFNKSFKTRSYTTVFQRYNFLGEKIPFSVFEYAYEFCKSCS